VKTRKPAKPKKKKIVWYACGGSIAKTGPFKTQLEATDAMRLIKTPARTRIVGNFLKGQADVSLRHEPEQRAEFPNNVFVWPEYT